MKHECFPKTSTSVYCGQCGARCVNVVSGSTSGVSGILSEIEADAFTCGREIKFDCVNCETENKIKLTGDKTRRVLISALKRSVRFLECFDAYENNITPHCPENAKRVLTELASILRGEK